MTDTPTEPEPTPQPDPKVDTAEHDVVREEFDPEVERDWPEGREEPDRVRERGHPDTSPADNLESAPDVSQEEIGYEGER